MHSVTNVSDIVTQSLPPRDDEPAVGRQAEQLDRAATSRGSDRFCTVGQKADFPAKLLISGPDQKRQLIDCQIADVHLGGCALRYQHSHALELQPAQVHFSVQQLEMDLKLAGHIRWSRQTGLGTYTSGLEFRQLLAPIVIESLLKSDKVTRRVAARKDVDVMVGVRQSNPSLVLNDSRLTSVSIGGVQLATDEPLELNSRLLISLPSGVSAMASSVWCVMRDDAYLSGATFLSPDQAHKFFAACG